MAWAGGDFVRNQLMGFVPLHSFSYKMTFAASSPPVFKPAKAFKEKVY